MIDRDELSEKPADILSENGETYRKKTQDYGQSWYNIGEILYLMAGREPLTLDSPEDFVRMGLYTRRLDKLARAFHGEFCGDLNYESVTDSHEDESTYAAMAAALTYMVEDDNAEYEQKHCHMCEICGENASETLTPDSHTQGVNLLVCEDCDE